MIANLNPVPSIGEIQETVQECWFREDKVRPQMGQRGNLFQNP